MMNRRTWIAGITVTSLLGCIIDSLQTRTEGTGNETDIARHGGFFPGS